MYESIKRKNANQISSFESDFDLLKETWDGRVHFSPKYLQIEHTTRCNARCIMCNHLYTGNRGAQDLNLNILQKLESIFPYVEIVMLNGDGEPFLYPFILESLRLFQKYEIKIGTNTNLTCIPDNIWDCLNESFAFLNISCDGSSKELYERIRKGLSFDLFVSNLKKLNSIAPSLSKNLDCVLMRQNIGDMVNLVCFASDYGFNSIKFHSLGINPIIENDNDAPDLYEYYLAQQIKKAKNAADHLGIKIEVPIVDVKEPGSVESDLRRIIEEEQHSTDRIGKAESLEMDLTMQNNRSMVSDNDYFDRFEYGDMCKWAVERCYIDLLGNVTTCCYDMCHFYGNLQEQSFEEIWNGHEYRLFRKRMIQGKLPEWCKYCQWIKQPTF